jgi:large subunit ribosomal protein L18
MGMKIRSKTNARQAIRIRKKSRIKKKIVLLQGKIARLVVYRSNKFLYAQVVDDLASNTLVQANTQEKSFESIQGSKKNLNAAKALGKLIGQRALEKKVDRVVFDRNGYDYHGRIKAIADGAREAGLNF